MEEQTKTQKLEQKVKKYERLLKNARKQYAMADFDECRKLLKEKNMTWDDVKRVPVVTKSMMRAARTDDILTRPFDSRLHNTHTTSGSSGTPFKIVYDKWVDYTGHARLLWLLMRHGYTPFKRIDLSTQNASTSPAESAVEIAG